MKKKQFLFVLTAMALVGGLEFISIAATAQSITTGDVTGIVTDPSGAAISNATVTLKNKETGATQTRNTNVQGVYRFPLLQPHPICSPSMA